MEIDNRFVDKSAILDLVSISQSAKVQVPNIVSGRDDASAKKFFRSSSASSLNIEDRRQLWMALLALTPGPAAADSDFGSQVYSEHPPFVNAIYERSDCLTVEGVEILKKITWNFHSAAPDVLFCPEILPLTAVFLVYLSPDDTLSTLRTMCCGDSYLYQTRKAHLCSSFILRDLFKKYTKSVYRNIEESKQNVASMQHWQCWMFAWLPLSYIVRVIDCLLVEGFKVLYRIHLVLFKQFMKSSYAKESFSIAGIQTDEIRLFYTNISQTISIQTVLGKAFAMRGFSRNFISRHYSTYLTSAAVQAEANTNSSNSGAFQPSVILSQLQSKLVNLSDVQFIWSHLPPRYQIQSPTLLFTTDQHGTNIRTLYSHLDDYEPTLWLIKATTRGDTESSLFGAYCSTSWRKRLADQKSFSYFGTGETFVFRLRPQTSIYRWVGDRSHNSSNNYSEEPTAGSTAPGGSAAALSALFLAGDNDSLAIGGGDGTAISLDAMLANGRSTHSLTFNNTPLTADSRKTDFLCVVLEVFCLEDL